MTEEKLTCRKARGNPLLVLLQRGLYTAAKQRSLEISVSPVSPGSPRWWGERGPSSSSDLLSSSFSSCTRPVRELQENSGCEQRTSVLDLESLWDSDHLSTREGRALLRMEHRRRDSSADTSRDIEDFEDLELDSEKEEEDEEEEDICDKEACVEEEDGGLELSERGLTSPVSPNRLVGYYGHAMRGSWAFHPRMETQ